MISDSLHLFGSFDSYFKTWKCFKGPFVIFLKPTTTQGGTLQTLFHWLYSCRDRLWSITPNLSYGVTSWTTRGAGGGGVVGGYKPCSIVSTPAGRGSGPLRPISAMELQAEQVINAFRLLISLTEKERKTVFLTRRRRKTLRTRKQRNYSCFSMVRKTWPVSVSQLDTQGRRENTTRVTSTLPSPRVSAFAQAFTISADLEPWTGGKKQWLLHARRKPNCKKGNTRELILLSHLACARLSVIADERKI